MNQKLKILLIEDNRADAELFREMVNGSQGSCELEVADRLASGLKLLERERFDAVFLDLGLPDSSGIDTLRRLQEQEADLPVIVLTGLADNDTAFQAISMGAQDYLMKGSYESEVLFRSVQYSIERKRNEVAIRERKELSDALNRLDNLLHSTLDLNTILARVIAGAAETIGVDASVVGLFENDSYIVKSVHNIDREMVGQMVPSREMKGILHAAGIRDAVAFNDAVNDSRLNQEMIRTFGVRSLLIAPFISKGVLTGAMTLISLSRPFPFREEHIDFARKLSFSISTALDNARLYDALKISEQLSRGRLSQLQAVYASAPVGLCFLDTELRFVNINQRLADINGVSVEKHVGRHFREVLSPALADAVEPHYRRVLTTGTAVENIEFASNAGDADGGRYWLNSYYPVRDPSGRIMGINAVVQEITPRKKMEEEIRHLANHDALSGLPNRRLFLELIRLAVAQARRHGSRLAVFFLDLDRFKIINDTLGHEAGDELLREVSAGLKKMMRSSDTVARIGGDEFNLLIGDVLAPEDAAESARKIMEYFSRPFHVYDQQFNITASAGISIFPDDSEDIDTLLRYADIAMYHAKEQGRNNYQFYDPKINMRSLELIKLENRLCQSVKREELLIYYQPLVDISTQTVVSAEALVRWQHPEMGRLDPARFIPLAEETGFITVIDEWMLRSVCRQMKRWIDAGLPSVCVTVNVSARLFENPGLVPLIQGILVETGIPARYLDLEITEGVAMSNVESSAARLKKLAEMGIHISIDDFGTGYSSLNYLKRLPIGRLKIDRSFVQDIATDPDDRTIIRAVTAMAHNMKMKVIAEGVETEEQLAFLRDTGCDEMQGFLFSKPLPADQFEELISSR